MNLKIFGFTWDVEAPNNIEDFLTYINSLNEVEMQNLNNGMPPGVNYHRIILTTDLEDDLWGGVFLTVKNARKFLRSKKLPKGSGKSIKITTGEIGSDENFADANFFIYNPSTKAGLYEYYHLSAHLNTFNYEILNKFKHYRSIKNIKGSFLYSQHLTKDEYEEKIKDLSVVHHVDYEFSTITPPDADMTPASGMVKRQRMRVFYDSRYQESEELKDGVTSFIKEKFDTLKRLFVKGKTITGEDVVYKIMSDPSVFDEREFKNFTVNLDIGENVDKELIESSNLKHLIAVSKRLNTKDFFYSQRQQ